jgi:ubiquitin-protein ligase
MSQILSKQFINRLINDVKYIKRNPLDSNGIYYLHDEDDLMTGYALIIGPKDTVYENGYYFFKLIFTPEYPNEPPLVKYMTNGGNVRFNPNLYTDGKVCVSLLNTWTGEQWTSCQNISSILLALCTLLNDNPLLNEPDVKSNDKEIPIYNTLLEYANFDIAICDVINSASHLYYSETEFIHLFKHVFIEHFLNNYQNHLSKIEKMIQNCKSKSKTKSIDISFYEYRGKLNYNMLQSKMKETYIILSNTKS